MQLSVLAHRNSLQMQKKQKNRDYSNMENWSMFGKPKEVEDKKSSVFKEYIVPLGSLLIPVITFLAQNTSPWWGSLAIAAYVAIVIIFLVVPAIIRGVKKWTTYSTRMRLEESYLPKISASLCRFKPMMESNRSDTIWGVWDNASRASEMQKFIRPNHSHYYTLAKWLEHLHKTVGSGKSKNFKLIASEASDWVQQYASFCRDAYLQFEDLLRSNQSDEFKVREIKQSWNHARDEHNQAISNWKNLCSEINSSFNQDICSAHYETSKTLE